MTPRKPKASPESPLWLMKRAWYYLYRAVNETLWEHGITATQQGALNRIVERPGISGAELARQMLITPQAAQLALTALERNGLVERKPDPNHGRILRNFVTDEGRRVTEICMRQAVEVQDRVIGVLDHDEQAKLLEYLRRLAQAQPGEGFISDDPAAGL